jgi:hypothetical protein
MAVSNISTPSSIPAFSAARSMNGLADTGWSARSVLMCLNSSVLVHGNHCRIASEPDAQQSCFHVVGVLARFGVTQRADDIAVLQQTNANEASIARATTAMVAQVVSKYVVACFMQRLICGVEVERFARWDFGAAALLGSGLAYCSKSYLGSDASD